MLPVILSIAATFLFGVITIILSIREERKEKLLKDREEKQKQKIYEISILKEIQERIGYELDVEKIIDVITGSLKDLFSYSVSSSIVIKDEKLIFKSHIEEEVSRAFVDQIKKGMLASLSAITDEPLPTQIEECLSGSLLDNEKNLPLSFFHIPLVVSNNLVGLINISSTKPGLYKEEQMTILYRITSQASNALTKLQDVLKTEKEKLMSLISSLADGVFMLDANNNLLVINNTAKLILGIQKEAPTVFEVLGLLPARYNFTGKIQTAILENKSIEEKEVSIGEKTIQVFITPVLSSLQKVIGISVLLHDVTLEKNLDQMKEDFTNVIIHELRAPLTAIRGAAQLLSTDQEKLNKEDQQKLTEVVHGQADKLLDEVSSLLDAAKLEAGRLTIEKAPTDIRKLIEDEIQIFSASAQNKNVGLTSQIENLPSKIDLDSFRISQAINNLISNSLKFTPAGGKITVSARMADDKIMISVTDTGIGVPKEKQDNLFSKFSQISQHPSVVKSISNAEADRNGTHPVGTGSGLGLYITKGIVEAHGGKISLESDIGTGTTISFTLPVEAKNTKEVSINPNFFP